MINSGVLTRETRNEFVLSSEGDDWQSSSLPPIVESLANPCRVVFSWLERDRASSSDLSLRRLFQELCAGSKDWRRKKRRAFLSSRRFSFRQPRRDYI